MRLCPVFADPITYVKDAQWILHFQMIIDITGACGTVTFDAECVCSPDNIICKKSLQTSIQEFQLE